MAKLRQLVAGTLRPFAFATRRLGREPGHRILMYHRVRDAAGDQLSVSVARFTEQMRYLSTHHRVLRLDALCDELTRNGISAPGVAVTFDDGYTDNLTNALPVLARFNIPAVIFAVSGFCDGKRQHARYPGEAQLHLSGAQLRELAAHPLIEIGSHTVNHPSLSALSEERAREEIQQSRQQLEALIGQPVRYFCYPSGDCQDRDVALLAEAGYAAAVTVAPGVNRPDTGRFSLRRTEVTDRDRAHDLALKLEGAYDLPHTVLHWRRQRRFRRLREMA